MAGGSPKAVRHSLPVPVGQIENLILKKLEEFVLCVLAFSSEPECRDLWKIWEDPLPSALDDSNVAVIKQSKAAC